MKLRENLTLAVLAGVVALPGQTGPDLTGRVELLEQQHAEALASRELLLSDLQGLSARVETLEAYITSQAAGARDLNDALQVVEDGGFATLRNWESRKHLLEALRAQNALAQKGLPGKGKPKGEGGAEDEAQTTTAGRR